MTMRVFGNVRKRDLINYGKGIAFISPWLLGFLAWTVYPILASLYYSFTRYDILNPPRWIGLENFTELFFHDQKFRIVTGNTLYFVIVGVPIGVIVAFLLAVLLNNELKLRPLFRTIFFLPSIVPAVATAMVWLWIYNPRYGLINSILANYGIAAVPWLSSASLAKNSLIIIHAWAQGGAMVIFLAALQDVPRSLYDAALVDGANTWRRFWHITIPLCTPAVLFVLLTSLINMFQYFTIGWLLTAGGPDLATEFYGIYLYRNAFQFFKMGYASAQAWILFVLVVLFTIAIFRSSARWVYYGGESQ
ncbi:sugar ABC transporter permease [soil metagenome]